MREFIVSFTIGQNAAVGRKVGDLWVYKDLYCMLKAAWTSGQHILWIAEIVPEWFKMVGDCGKFCETWKFRN